MAEPLPSLAEILTSDGGPDSPLAITLATLLEPTPILLHELVPELAPILTAYPPLVQYTQLIDRAMAAVNTWDDIKKAQFIHGHPRIGAVKNLSALSAREQGGGRSTGRGETETPPEVIARLEFLNKCYEKRYPGLVYITFVNGRSRAQIRDEMEQKLRREGALPSNAKEIADILPCDIRGIAWKFELNRAVGDIGKIAKSRLGKFGVQ